MNMQETYDALETIVVAAELTGTDRAVFAGIILRATEEERDAATNLVDVIQLYLKTAARVHNEIRDEIKEALNIELPAVSLKGLEEALDALAEGHEGDETADVEVPEGRVLH